MQIQTSSQLTPNQVSEYKEQGFLFLEKYFSDEEIREMVKEIPAIISEDSPRRILEKSGAVRSVFAPEKTSDVFKKAVRLERLIEPCKQLLESDIYIHQTKLNCKKAFIGDWWEWHQDFPYWSKDDGMPESRVLTVMIFLDDVTEFNGPMFVIPGSHHVEIAELGTKNTGADGWYSKYENSTSYMSALTSNLKYTLSEAEVAKWINARGIYSAKGPAGSALFFHGSVFHSSTCNLSPWDRNTFLVTYNSTENKLNENHPTIRPDFLANRDFTSIKSISDDSLLVKH